MRTRTKWVLGSLAGLLAAYGLVVAAGRHRVRQEYEAQLRMAREAGIPTSPEEFAATIPRAKPEENAAPLYRKLNKLNALYRNKTSPHDLEILLVAAHDERAAADFIRQHQDQYATLDAATRLPRCWFSRDWSLGAAVLMPEFSDMKEAGRWLGLRGSLAAMQGRHRDALADASRIFIMGNHAAEQGDLFAQLVKAALDQIAMRDLVTWASMHRDQPAYREALARAIDEYPKRDLWKAHLGDLYLRMGFLAMMETPTGRAELGLRPEQHSLLDKVMPFVIDQEKAKIEIVKWETQATKLLKANPIDDAAVYDARLQRDKAMFAFPTAAFVYDALTNGDAGDTEDLHPEQAWLARKQRYIALLRATEGAKVPATIKTSDLLSPYDGKPLHYRFDGKTVEIEVSGEKNDYGPVKFSTPVFGGKVLAAGKLPVK